MQKVRTYIYIENNSLLKYLFTNTKMYVRSNHNRRKIVRCGLFDIRAQVIAVDDRTEYNNSDVRRSNSREV
jgi:hypothetical protein